jgi:hypothetical protein
MRDLRLRASSGGRFRRADILIAQKQRRSAGSAFAVRKVRVDQYE